MVIPAHILTQLKLLLNKTEVGSIVVRNILIMKLQLSVKDIMNIEKGSSDIH